MKMQGDYLLDASRQEIRQALMDPEVLKAPIPDRQSVITTEVGAAVTSIVMCVIHGALS